MVVPTMVMPAETGPAQLLSPQACKLWAAYQSAAGTLGESMRELGFVDLVRPSLQLAATSTCPAGWLAELPCTQVVYGRQTTGKSSLLGALCGVQLPTGENQVRPCPLLTRT